MVHTYLLWFLPLALVPVILHLITLYRLRTLELPTFRFLMDSYIQQRRKLKLLELLLMLLRTAFVALIIFTLSRPVLHRFNWLSGQNGRDVAIIIDAGASMGLRTGGTTSLERAQAAARSIVGLLAPDDHVTLVRAGEKPQVLANRLAGQPQPILEEIGRVKPGATSSNIAAAFEEIFGAPQHGSRVVYILTDASRRAWAPLAGNPLTQAPASDRQVVVMNVGPTTPVINLAAIGEPPRLLHPIVGLPVLLSATVVNGSSEHPKDTLLSVMLDDQQVSQIPLSLQPGQKITKAVTVTPTRAGTIRGRFQLPADAFPDDDAYLFCLNVEPKVSVVIATPPPAPPPAGAADLFIRTALKSPLAAETGQFNETQKIAASLDVTSVVSSALTDAMLTAADVVILADVPIDASLGPLLRKFVSAGGGLMIFPGAHVQPDACNANLLNPPAPAAAGAILGARPTLLAPVGNLDDEAKFQPLSSIDLTHPILSAFAEPGTDYFGTVRIYRYFPIRLPPAKDLAGNSLETADRSNVLMRLPDRTPMLVESKLGEGKILLAAFPPTPDWSNVPLKPQFVPILLRAVAHLRRSSQAEAPPAIKPHEPAPVYLTERWPDAKVEVLDPTGKPTAVSLHRSGKQMVGAFNETERKGYYTFRVLPRAAAGVSGGDPQRVELGFAVNLDITGADFAMLNEAQMKETLKPMAVTYLRGSANDPGLAQELRQKREIWRTLIWVMFAVIGIEFLLATLTPSRGVSKASPPASASPRGPLGRLTSRLAEAFAGSEEGR